MVLPIRNSRIRLSHGQMFWREVGYGKALIFLHDSWSDSSEWVPVIEQLLGKYHCSAVDLLGFGESDYPKMHYSIELEVECLAEYLELLKFRQIHLVGHGLGGWIAASYALRYPEQVESLVLLGAEGLQTKSDRRWQSERWLTRLPILLWLMRSLSPLVRLLGRGEQLDQLLALKKKLKRSPAACQLLFRRRRAEISAELLHDRLQWLKLPILILQGDQDEAAIVAQNEAYAQAPHAKLHVLEGKELIQTAPEKVAEEIRSFVGYTNSI